MKLLIYICIYIACNVEAMCFVERSSTKQRKRLEVRASDSLEECKRKCWENIECLAIAYDKRGLCAILSTFIDEHQCSNYLLTYEKCEDEHSTTTTETPITTPAVCSRFTMDFATCSNGVWSCAANCTMSLHSADNERIGQRLYHDSGNYILDSEAQPSKWVLDDTWTIVRCHDISYPHAVCHGTLPLVQRGAISPNSIYCLAWPKLVWTNKQGQSFEGGMPVCTEKGWIVPPHNDTHPVFVDCTE